MINYTIFNTDKNIKYIVFNSPSESGELLKLINKFNINIIFRLCEPLYDKNDIDIKFIDQDLPDGSFPSIDIINNFIFEIDNLLLYNKHITIGIHCKAGLGRAPLITAILMMNYDKKISSFDVITNIRNKIKGSINSKQLNELKEYENNISSQNKCKCVIC
jgi:protein tyrosine phosphatase type 4A